VLLHALTIVGESTLAGNQTPMPSNARDVHDHVEHSFGAHHVTYAEVTHHRVRRNARELVRDRRSQVSYAD